MGDVKRQWVFLLNVVKRWMWNAAWIGRPLNRGKWEFLSAKKILVLMCKMWTNVRCSFHSCHCNLNTKCIFCISLVKIFTDCVYGSTEQSCFHTCVTVCVDGCRCAMVDNTPSVWDTGHFGPIKSKSNDVLCGMSVLTNQKWDCWCHVWTEYIVQFRYIPTCTPPIPTLKCSNSLETGVK